MWSANDYPWTGGGLPSNQRAQNSINQHSWHGSMRGSPGTFALAWEGWGVEKAQGLEQWDWGGGQGVGDAFEVVRGRGVGDAFEVVGGKGVEPLSIAG